MLCEWMDALKWKRSEITMTEKRIKQDDILSSLLFIMHRRLASEKHKEKDNEVPDDRI